MTTIVTRAGKGSPLTHTEVDTNFTNLNTAKFETAAIPLGTLAAPSISFVGDANTGIYSPGADTVAFVTAGGNRVHITSGGLLGIGTSSPSALLHVLDSSSTTTTPLILRNYAASVNTKVRIALQGQTASNQGANAFIQSLSGTDAGGSNSNNDSGLQFIVTNGGGATENQAMTINTQGRVGIGTTTPVSILDVTVGGSGTRKFVANYDDSIITIKGANNSSDPETLRLVADNLRFSTGTSGSGTERARIDSSGRLLVGTSSAPSNGELLRVTKASSGTEGAAINLFGEYSLADDASQTITLPHAALIMVTEQTTGRAGLLFATYDSATITTVSDPSNIIATSDTDTKLCVFKSAATNNITVKNRLGATRNIGVGKITML